MSCNPFLAGALPELMLQQFRISDCELRTEFQEEFQTVNYVQIRVSKIRNQQFQRKFSCFGRFRMENPRPSVPNPHPANSSSAAVPP